MKTNRLNQQERVQGEERRKKRKDGASQSGRTEFYELHSCFSMHIDWPHCAQDQIPDGISCEEKKGVDIF